MRRVALVLVCLGIACTDGSGATPHTASTKPAESTPKAEPAPPPETKRTWPLDTPPATACTAHDECTVVPTAPGDDPCCEITVTIGPRTKRYLEFAADYRKQHCADVECPPLSLPGAQPAECGFVGRCLNGHCDIGCNDPAYMAAGGDRPGGPTPPDPSTCVAECVARRQMQAIAASAIEAACRRDCDAGTPVP